MTSTGFRCRVEADSLSPNGVRLTTFVVTYPRCIHSEVLTHRMLSRNSSSSRAIPVEKQIAAVVDDPYIPTTWGVNQKGMQAGSEEVANPGYCRMKWLDARDEAVGAARCLLSASVHKQWVNRLLEPFAWITVVISGTSWNNFFALRCHPDAMPELQRVAGMMRDARADSEPQMLQYGQWHLPFVTRDELAEVRAGDDAVRERYKLVSAGRAARVSYLTHDGKRDQDADIALAQRLIAAVPKHSSPLEHVARPATELDRPLGNFRGWRQFRHEIADESVPD